MVSRITRKIRKILQVFLAITGKLTRTAENVVKRVSSFRGEKEFCIGRNKTDTTSLKTVFSDLWYRVGDQRGLSFQFIIECFSTAEVQ